MNYELSANDRFFLNQLLPRWASIRSFDLQGDLKYVFHREKGTNYNEAQFEYVLETLREFLSDHGFAKEIPAKKYSFTILPKGNVLVAKGTIELFEKYQGSQENTVASLSGKVITKPRRNAVASPLPAEPEVYFSPEQVQEKKKPNKKMLQLLMVVTVCIIAVIAYAAMNAVKHH